MNVPDPRELEARLTELTEQSADPALARNVAKMKEIAQERRHTEELLEHVHQFVRLRDELQQAQELVEGNDADLAAMAQEDVVRLQGELTTTEATMEQLLVPRDPLDSRDVIVEIRAGAGGDESSLFAAELFRAYTRYAEGAGWKVHIVNSSRTEADGFKEVVAEVSGSDVFGTLKFERGVHRVQRIPVTEKQGRVHTSTVTVAVLPQADEVDIEIKPEDLRIDTYRASGAGGQHVNKTDSAIRITHVPTNTVVAVQDERSQHKNKAKALSILRARLLEVQEERKQAAEAKARKSQVGTGDRSEKIRTYNYPQDRITDHRIKESWSNIPGVLEGAWQPIFDALRAADTAARLADAS